MSDEDANLEADYEDRNGDPHGIGSPEYEEEPMTSEEYDSHYDPDDYL